MMSNLNLMDHHNIYKYILIDFQNMEYCKTNQFDYLTIET